jgi:hypothetical protein
MPVSKSALRHHAAAHTGSGVPQKTGQPSLLRQALLMLRALLQQQVCVKVGTQRGMAHQHRHRQAWALGRVCCLQVPASAAGITNTVDDDQVGKESRAKRTVDGICSMLIC